MIDRDILFLEETIRKIDVPKKQFWSMSDVKDPTTLLKISPPVGNSYLNEIIIKNQPSEEISAPLHYKEDYFLEKSESYQIEPLHFHPVQVEPVLQRPHISGLSVALMGSTKNISVAEYSRCLTIYLPGGDTLNIVIVPTLKIVDIIERIFDLHERENIQPPLAYGHPQYYQLRIHDFEGLPDEDFPPLDFRATLDDYGVHLTEYCLVQISGIGVLPFANHPLRSNKTIDTAASSDCTPPSISIKIYSAGKTIKLRGLSKSVRFIDLVPLVAMHLRIKSVCIKLVYKFIKSSD